MSVRGGQTGRIILTLLAATLSGMCGLACSPQYEVGQVLDIPVEPGPGTLLVAGIVLDQMSVRVGTLDRDTFNPWNGEEHDAGDRCLLVSGRMRSTTTENLGVDFWVNGYNSEGNQVAWTLTSDRLPGHAHLTVLAESGTDFEIVVSCVNEIRWLVVNASTDSERITLQPKLGTALADGLVLEQASVHAATLKQAAFNVQSWRHYSRGDWCLMVSGRVRNTTSELLDVDMWVDGCDSEGERVASTLASGTQEGYVHFDVPGESSQDFEIAVSWTDEIRSLEIGADSNDRMIPSPPVFPPSALPDGLVVSPSVGTYLTNSKDRSSELLLLVIQFDQVGSHREYRYRDSEDRQTIKLGDPILVISGSLQNRHRAYRKITMYAQGYDAAGEQVSWTLDAAHLPGEIGLDVEPGHIAEFTLHLNLADDIESIHIFASTSPILPP